VSSDTASEGQGQDGVSSDSGTDYSKTRNAELAHRRKRAERGEDVECTEEEDDEDDALAEHEEDDADGEDEVEDDDADGEDDNGEEEQEEAEAEKKQKSQASKSVSSGIILLTSSIERQQETSQTWSPI